MGAALSCACELAVAFSGQQKKEGGLYNAPPSSHRRRTPRDEGRDAAPHPHLVHTLNHDGSGGDGSDDDDGGDVDDPRDEYE